MMSASFALGIYKYSMRYSEITENEIIDASGFVWKSPALGSPSGELDGETIYQSVVDGHTIIAVGNPAKAYGILTKKYRMNYLVELQSDPALRNQGWGTRLLVHMAKHHGRLMIDQLLSTASASMIEKLIDARLVSAHIAYLDRDRYTPYDPSDEKDRTTPMYDKTVFSVLHRPMLDDPKEARNRTWILESWSEPRHPMLQKISHYLE